MTNLNSWLDLRLALETMFCHTNIYTSMDYSEGKRHHPSTVYFSLIETQDIYRYDPSSHGRYSCFNKYIDSTYLSKVASNDWSNDGVNNNLCP
jgi:hypothetical protein